MARHGGHAPVPRDAGVREEGARAVPEGDAVRAAPGARRGYTLVALLAAVADHADHDGGGGAVVALRDEERRRGGADLPRGEIADAIARYQRRNGNALPPSLEVLVKGKFLRREYKDPMTKHGRWRFLRPGEVGRAGPAPGGARPRGGDRRTTTTTTTTRPSAFSQPGNATLGGFQGVASTSTDEEPARVQRPHALRRVGVPARASPGSSAARVGARRCPGPRSARAARSPAPAAPPGRPR